MRRLYRLLCFCHCATWTASWSGERTKPAEDDFFLLGSLLPVMLNVLSVQTGYLLVLTYHFFSLVSPRLATLLSCKSFTISLLSLLSRQFCEVATKWEPRWCRISDHEMWTGRYNLNLIQPRVFSRCIHYLAFNDS